VHQDACDNHAPVTHALIGFQGFFRFVTRPIWLRQLVISTLTGCDGIFRALQLFSDLLEEIGATKGCPHDIRRHC
jgi:hypothetical protein